MYFKVSERDLDILQLEELHSDSGYAAWFSAQIGLGGALFETALHSVSRTAEGSNGETDVMAIFVKDGRRIAVLIEDKISAGFTLRQAQRYVERGADLVSHREVDAFLTVIVAPKSYLAGVPVDDPWNYRISLEDLGSWFAEREGHHAQWRRQIVKSAINRSNATGRGSSEEMMSFSVALSRYLADHYAPELRHDPKPDISGPTIKYPGCSGKKMLWWKFGSTAVWLQLYPPYIGVANGIDLPPSVILEEATTHNRKSDNLYIPVERYDLSVSFEKQIDVVESAILAARNLLVVLGQIEAKIGLLDQTIPATLEHVKR